MGKRSNFPRKKNDFYETTDPGAVEPLVRHLAPNTLYHEPCAGKGALIDQLGRHGHICLCAGDVEPGMHWMLKCDAMNLTSCYAPVFITNPPWSWHLLLPLIDHLTSLAPTWMLLSADFMHNEYDWEAKQVGTRTISQMMQHCRIIQSVGRVKWEPGSKGKGKDNCAWYLFDQRDTPPGDGPVFYPKVAVDKPVNSV